MQLKISFISHLLFLFSCYKTWLHTKLTIFNKPIFIRPLRVVLHHHSILQHRHHPPSLGISSCNQPFCSGRNSAPPRLKSLWFVVFNRPGVAGAILQTPPSLINYLIESPFSPKPSKHHYTQTMRDRELTFWENIIPLPCVTCKMSCVTCQVSCVGCHVELVKFFFFFFLSFCFWKKLWG